MLKTKYPFYIISKGRWKKPLTAMSLDEMGVAYKIVVEPKEYGEYSKIIDKKKIICLDENLSEQGCGSIPVRNWVWEHSISEGYERHWLLDDNILGFQRLNRNTRYKVLCDSIFIATENFVDRYENIAFAGFEYRQFGGGARRPKPPFKLNYRVYSTTLINNSLPYRWRGKFNEDTDICIRALKDGWVTVTFNCFLQNKIATNTMKGGNHDLYQNTNNRLEFVESLYNQHPDIVKKVFRYGRWHHEVDYSNFKQKLIFKKDVVLKDEINEFGMKLMER